MSQRPEPESPFAAAVVPSPNHGERRNGRRPDTLLLHYTGMQDGPSALQRLCDPLAQVSAHYLVFEDGRIVQMVAEARRAWHAGASSWKGEADINSASLGVEIVNPGHDGGLPPFPPAQISSVVALCRDLIMRWSIAPERVLAHSDVAPTRKRDPGERFPWDELHRAGIGRWVAPAMSADGRFLRQGDAGEPVEALQAMLALIGYGVPVNGVFDAPTAAAVAAFQRHFRPARIDGVADGSTVATLRNLIAAEAGGA